MNKQYNKIFLFFIFLLILIIIPVSFAQDNQTNFDLSVTGDVLSDEINEIYFDASASVDGDGSKESPYNNTDVSKLKNNTKIYLENGQYSLSTKDLSLSDVNVYGKNPKETVINLSYGKSLSNINLIGKCLISNMTFINGHFSVNGTVEFLNCNFVRNTTYFYTYGGAIYSEEACVSNLTVNNCTFKNYVAYAGGAILTESGKLTVKNSEFINGESYLTNRGQNGEGASIMSYKSELKVYDSYFHNNVASGFGVIYTESSNSLISNCRFENNRAAKSGGAITNFKSNTTIDKCNFTNNTAKSGGAVYNYIANVNISNSVFENNNATLSGGAIYNSNNNNLTIANSRFSKNFAETYGGAITSYYLSQTEIANTSFENCSSNRLAGALFSETSNLKLDGVNITGCEANFGAAILGLITYTQLNNVKLDRNSAKYNGGAVYQMYGTFACNNSQLTSNSAGNGGALYFNKVTIGDLNSNHFINNHAVNGSAYYFIKVNESKIGENAFENNEVLSIESVELFLGDGNYTMMKNDDSFDGTLPSSYTSPYGSSVKDQGDGGYCWAFTAISVLESAIMKATGIEYDLSENNLINLNKLYSSYGLSTNEQGGTIINALGYLLSWLGPVNESMDTYESYSKMSPVFNSLMHVQNVLFIDIKNKTDINPIKEAILRYGAVGSFLTWYQWSPYQYGSNYYFDGNYPINHAVTIVGWDDNYSKYNFGNTPEGDGAWIVKNSWGTGIGKDGYFYVSYYSNDLNLDNYNHNPLNRLYSFVLNDTIRFDKNYQYDYAGATGYRYYNNEAWMKNVFTSTEDEYLAGVSTYFLKDSEYEVFIHVNDVMVHNQSGITKSGYYTINLNKLISLKKGDNFSVMFNLKSLDGSHVIIPTVDASDVVMNNFKKGISYFGGSKDSLYDVGEYSIACIKAFTRLNAFDSLMNLTVDYDEFNPVNITVNIFGEKGDKLRYGDVVFNLSGVIKAVKVVNGVAFISHNFKSGNNTITATFNADGYKSSQKTTTVNIKKLMTDMKLDIKTNLDTAVLNIETIPAVERVIFKINDDIIILNLTEGKGKLELDDLNNGNYAVEAEIDNPIYEATNTSSFTINVKKPMIICEDITINENSDYAYIIKLVDENNNIMADRELKINLDNKDSVIKTNSSGEALININLKGGKYNLTVLFENDGVYLQKRVVKSINVKGYLTCEIKTTKNLNNVFVEINLSKNVNVDLIVSVNGDNRTVNIVNGYASFNLNNLENDNYTIESYLDNSDYNFESAKSEFTINVVKTTLSCSNYQFYYMLYNSMVIRLFDENNVALANKQINIVFNGDIIISNKTNENGVLIIRPNILPGYYVAVISFDGDEDCMPSQVTRNVEVLSTIELYNNMIKYNSPYKVKILGSSSVELEIDGKTYNPTIDSDRIASLNLNLKPGNYQVKIKNLINNEEKIQYIQIFTPLSENNDVIMYYGGGNVYKVKVLDDNGNPAKGVKLTIKIGSQSKTVTTDSNGYANLKITSMPGKYTITTTYNGFEVSNKLTVKTTLIVNNIKVKKGKNVKLTAKVLNTKGKALKNKKVIFKFNGKKYTAKTNKKGIAKVTINKKALKKLKVGKKVKYQVSYGKVTKMITVKVKR